MSQSQKEVSLKAYKALEYKVRKLEIRTKDLRKEGRYLRKRIKSLTNSRDNWKDKAVIRQQVYKSLEKRQLRQTKLVCPKRHHSPTWLITLVIVLRIYCNCSYGSIKRIVDLLHEDYFYGKGLQGGINSLPCEKTYQNWVSKVGYYYIQSIDNELNNKGKTPVSLIIDESIRVGREKLFLALLLPIEKQKEGSLSYEDVSVFYLQGALSWTGDKIAKALESKLSENNFELKYILSDEGNNLKRSAKELQTSHIADISHLVATCLKKTFKGEEAYQALSKSIKTCQSKLAMGQYCYLRPPKQRAKARFLNQEKVVSWAEVIFKKWDTIDLKAQEKLVGMQEYKSIIVDLKTCIDLAKKIANPLKIKGLNRINISQSLKEVQQQIENQENCMYVKTFAKFLKEYLIKYQNFITQEEWKNKTVHVCSDVIERLFGIYKAKVSDNYFVTSSTIGLELPLMCLSKKTLIQNIQLALESIKMTDLKTWRNKQDTDNQSGKRAKFFKK